MLLLAKLDLNALYPDPPDAQPGAPPVQEKIDAERVWLLLSRIFCSLNCAGDGHPYYIRPEAIKYLCQLVCRLWKALRFMIYNVKAVSI